MFCFRFTELERFLTVRKTEEIRKAPALNGIQLKLLEVFLSLTKHS